MSTASGRYLHVDALRAVAALLVVWTHSTEIFLRGFAGDSLLPQAMTGGGVIDFGRIGVVVFFAISGFVIPASLSSAPGALKTFATKRFFRLYPAYWVSVGLAALLAFGLASRRDPTLGQVLANLSMVQEFFGGVSLQGLYWTLHVELVFYLLCGLAWWLGLGQRRAFLPAMAIVLGLCFAAALAVSRLDGQGKLSGMHTVGMYCLHLSIMCWGGVVRRWYDGEALDGLATLVLKGAMLAWTLVFGLTLVAALGGRLAPSSDFFRLGISYPLGILGFVLAVQGWRQPRPLMAWLGQISYSIYLLHPVVVIALAAALDSLGLAVRSVGLFALLQVIGMALSVAAAALCFRYVEKPAMDLGAHLGRRVATRASVA